MALHVVCVVIRAPPDCRRLRRVVVAIMSDIIEYTTSPQIKFIIHNALQVLNNLLIM